MAKKVTFSMRWWWWWWCCRLCTRPTRL